MALALVAGTSLTSCKDDTQPRLVKPTEFVLNTPVMANQTYVLSKDNGIDLTVSQPDYGQGDYDHQLGVVTNYQTQISYDPNFAEYADLDGISNQAKISLSGESVAQAMCKLMGYVSNDTENLFSPEARKVYFRVRAYVTNCDYSDITSNAIALTVVPYKAVKLPARIYVIGDVQGWDINSDALYLEEASNAIGSNIFSGVIDITSAQAAGGFRFYTATGAWGDNGQLPSIGSNADDGNNASVQMEDGVYSGPCVTGKGNWNITNFDGTKMKMTVNLNTMKVIFETAE